jgi:hypothetical protein
VKPPTSTNDETPNEGSDVTRHRPDGTIVFSVREDPAAGIARVHAVGFWSLSETHQFVLVLSKLMVRLRHAYGSARILSDISGMPVQSDDVARCLGEANARLFEASDRLAVIVDSYLVRGQWRRQFSRDNSQAFLSPSAAEIWLRA